MLLGNPEERQGLAMFVHNLRRGRGLCIFADIVHESRRSLVNDRAASREDGGSASSSGEEREQFDDDVLDVSNLLARLARARCEAFIQRHNMSVFSDVISSNSFALGADGLMRTTGLGTLRPNTLIMGFKENWFSNDAATSSLGHSNKEESKGVKRRLCGGPTPWMSTSGRSGRHSTSRMVWVSFDDARSSRRGHTLWLAADSIGSSKRLAPCRFEVARRCGVPLHRRAKQLISGGWATMAVLPFYFRICSYRVVLGGTARCAC